MLDDEEDDYVYGPENIPVEEIFGLNAHYLHHDQQGSTRALTYWEEGEPISWTSYGPYGNVLESSPTKSGLGYDAQPTDPETGLIWLGARRYDPNTAQFMSIDPALESTGAPYSYAMDDPENRSDPRGECSTTASAAAAQPNWAALVKECFKGIVEGMVVAAFTAGIFTPETAIIGCLTNMALEAWKEAFGLVPGPAGLAAQTITAAFGVALAERDYAEVIAEAPSVLAKIWASWRSVEELKEMTGQ